MNFNGLNVGQFIDKLKRMEGTVKYDLDLFSVPVADLASGPTLQAPFQAGSHSSAMGAIDAARRVNPQCATLLAMYQKHGDLTDQDMEDVTGIDRSTVIPRRRELMKQGLVIQVGHRKNPRTGISNTTYGRVNR